MGGGGRHKAALTSPLALVTYIIYSHHPRLYYIACVCYTYMYLLPASTSIYTYVAITSRSRLRKYYNYYINPGWYLHVHVCCCICYQCYLAAVCGCTHWRSMRSRWSEISLITNVSFLSAYTTWSRGAVGTLVSLLSPRSFRP